MNEVSNQNRDAATQQYLCDLHKENTLFLNKAMLAVPALMLPLLFPLYEKTPTNSGKIFLLGAIASLGISVLLVLYSFFTSEEAIESIEKANIKNLEKTGKGRKYYLHAVRLNDRVKNQNKWVFGFIVAGFVCSLAAVAVPFILTYTPTKGDIMTDKQKQAHGQDGLTISCTATRPGNTEVKNGLSISATAFANVAAGQQTQTTPAPAAPANNTTEAKK